MTKTELRIMIKRLCIFSIFNIVLCSHALAQSWFTPMINQGGQFGPSSTNVFRANLIAGTSITFTYGTNGEVTISSSATVAATTNFPGLLVTNNIYGSNGDFVTVITNTPSSILTWGWWTNLATPYALTSWANSISNLVQTKQSGLILASNFFGMGISNIVAASGIAIGTNAGVLWITNTSSGGSGALTTNGNQFGANTVLNIKDGVKLTNVVAYGFTNNGAMTNTGNLYVGGNITVGSAHGLFLLDTISAPFLSTTASGEVGAADTTLFVPATNGISYNQTGHLFTAKAITGSTQSPFRVFDTNGNPYFRFLTNGVLLTGTNNLGWSWSNNASVPGRSATLIISNTPVLTIFNDGTLLVLGNQTNASTLDVAGAINGYNGMNVSGDTANFNNSASVAGGLNISSGDVTLSGTGKYAGNGSGITNAGWTKTFSSTNFSFLFTRNSDGSTNVAITLTNLAGLSGGGSSSVVTNVNQFGATTDGTLALKDSLLTTNLVNQTQLLAVATNYPGMSNTPTITVSNSFPATLAVGAGSNLQYSASIAFDAPVVQTGSGSAGYVVHPRGELVWISTINASNITPAGTWVFQSRAGTNAPPVTNALVTSSGNITAPGQFTGNGVGLTNIPCYTNFYFNTAATNGVPLTTTATNLVTVNGIGSVLTIPQAGYYRLTWGFGIWQSNFSCNASIPVLQMQSTNTTATNTLYTLAAQRSTQSGTSLELAYQMPPIVYRQCAANDVLILNMGINQTPSVGGLVPHDPFIDASFIHP